MIGLISELLYPSKCLVCRQIVSKGQPLCTRCEKQIIHIGEHHCIRCGKPVEEEQTICKDCRVQKHNFKRNFSPLVYQGEVKKIMYDFKYRKNRRAGDYFANEIIESFGELLQAEKFDGIIPIPLHKSKKKSRGYNQAELIARSLGEKLKIPVYESYLIRKEKTRPQKELNDSERKNNMKNAFLIGKNEVQLYRILLVDDIYTTGTTLDSAAKILKQNGVQEIICVTACIGRGY